MTRTHSIYVRAEQQCNDDFFNPTEISQLAQILPKEDISKKFFNQCDI